MNAFICVILFMKIRSAAFMMLLLVSCAAYNSAGDSNYSTAKELYRQSVAAESQDEKHKLRLEIIRLSPRSEYGLFSRGWLLYGDSDHEGAVSFYTRAIAVNPGESLFYYNRAVSLLVIFKKSGKGEYLALARQDLDRSIELDGSYAPAFTMRAEVKIITKNYAAAVDDYTCAIKLREKDPQLWYSRGLARLRGLNDSRGAESDASTAIRLDPRFAAAWCLRGLARFNMNDKKGACSDYRKAGSIDPESCLFGGEGGIIPGCGD